MLIGKFAGFLRLRRPPRRDNWPGRAQDGDQALNANVKVFMADFEDSLAPDGTK